MSFMRLTVRAKQSFSGLNPFCDGYNSSNDPVNFSPVKHKENDTPDLQEFGSLRSYADSTCSEAHPSSPAKDSPSRRKKLLGSLRSMSSLRSVRSPPAKEKGKERTERAASPIEPESLCTPIREVRPSLALNFQQSPLGQPMFNLRRRRSVSSSLVVHHSSPVAIPTPGQQYVQPYSVPAHPSDLPDGTVPQSPAPLQIALKRDTSQLPNVTDTAPPHLRTEVATELLPTPMPGTNLGFSDNDLIGSWSPSQEQGASLQGLTSYFKIPIVGSSERTDMSNVDSGVDGEWSASVHEDALLNTHQRDSSAMLEGSYHTVEGRQIDDAGSDRTAPTHPLDRQNVPTDQEFSPINIEHIIYEDSSDLGTANHQPNLPVYLTWQARAQMGLQMDLQMQAHADTLPPANEEAHSAPPLDTWGTHGSLYDGTGYGDESSSISPRPSTSSTAPEAASEAASNAVHKTALFAEDSAAMAQDHETLEEVIRAYAAFEEEGTSGTSEGVLEYVVADVELANTMADHSLGA